MSLHRVVVTGMGGVCAFGQTWEEIREKLKAGENAVRVMPEFNEFEGLNTRSNLAFSAFGRPDFGRQTPRGEEINAPTCRMPYCRAGGLELRVSESRRTLKKPTPRQESRATAAAIRG